jgi:hypothetical protein
MRLINAVLLMFMQNRMTHKTMISYPPSFAILNFIVYRQTVGQVAARMYENFIQRDNALA